MQPLKFNVKLETTPNYNPANPADPAFYVRMLGFFNHLAILLIVLVSFFSAIYQTNLNGWDMRKYCENEYFNQASIKTDTHWANIYTFFCIVFMVFMIFLRSRLQCYYRSDMILLSNFIVGIFLSLNLCYFVQNLIGLPSPSFYSNTNLKTFYCTTKMPNIEMEKLRNLDMLARGTFPSVFITLATYSVTCCGIYLSIIDKKKHYFTKLFVTVMPCLFYAYNGFMLWRNGQNHIVDLVGGALLGGLVSIMAMQCIIDKKTDLKKLEEGLISVMVVEDGQRPVAGNGAGPRPLDLNHNNLNNARAVARRETF